MTKIRHFRRPIALNARIRISVNTLNAGTGSLVVTAGSSTFVYDVQRNYKLSVMIFDSYGWNHIHSADSTGHFSNHQHPLRAGRGSLGGRIVTRACNIDPLFSRLAPKTIYSETSLVPLVNPETTISHSSTRYYWKK